ncbi:MAG TPA: PAS domain-containing protein [Acidimicrobiales bacterium]|nr:PAS domain-containing protein [Acidimicrobiales bacterium]
MSKFPPDASAGEVTAHCQDVGPQDLGLSSEELRLLCMDNLLAGGVERIYFKDRLGKFLLVSRKWMTTYAPGKSQEEIVGLTDADVFSPEHACDAFLDEQRVIETGEPVVGKLERETFWEGPDAWTETSKMPLRDREGRIIGTFGLSRYVTEEYRAMSRQKALAKVGEALANATTRQQIYQALLSGALDVVIEKVPRAAIVVTGGLAPVLAASTPEPVEHPSLLQATAGALEELASLSPRPLVVRRDNLVVLPIGTAGHAGVLPAHEGTGGGALYPLLGALVLESARDLSDHSLQALTWLASTVGVILDRLVTARRLRSLVSNTSDGMVVVGQDGRVRYAAESLERSFGYRPEEVIGRNLAELVQPADLARLSRALGPASASDGSLIEVRWRHRDGSWRDTETKVANLLADPEVEGFALSVRDVTERKSLEVELRQAQKLQAIGQLAGGVAHEINTPVQFIADNLQFLQDSFEVLRKVIEAHKEALEALPPGVANEAKNALREVEQQADLAFLEEEVPNAVHQALEGSRRVARIVHALKAFGHPDRGEAVATDLNESLRNTIIVARGETKYVSDVVEDLNDLPLVTVVPGEIGQVFLNLIVNAAHAIGDKVKGTEERGHITVKTWQEDDEVFVSVADDGAGMPEDVKQRVFEPFFTTKEVGRGTGQGLALARAVVERHGGTIRFESALGKGTAFVIRLPVNPSSEQGAP